MPPQKPTPQLRAALKELLEQQVTLPDEIFKHFQFEPNKEERWGHKVIGPNNRVPEGFCRTNLKNPMTMQQLLSGLAHVIAHDAFITEGVRDSHINSPSYNDFLIKQGPKLNDYLSFFTTITIIVDQDRIPDNLAVDQVSAG